jgi:hypothetical protein
MPSKFVDRVHFFACANKQGLNFGNCNSVPDDEDPFDSNSESYNSEDDSNDEADGNSVDYDSNDNDDAVNNNASIPTAGVDAADDNDNSLLDSLDSSSSDSSDKEDDNSDDSKDSSEDNKDSEDSGDNAGTNDTNEDNDDNEDKDDNYNDNENEPTANAQVSMEEAMDTQYGKRGTNPNLHPRHTHDYGHLHATLEGIMMSQYNMKKGIKLFGQDGVNAVLSKLSQLHDRSVLDPKDAKTLSQEEKKAAPEYLMFLKKK